LDGIGADIEKPGKECLAGIERKPYSPNFSRLEGAGRWRDFLRSEVHRFALLVGPGVSQRLA
jgi:hypothetical protein